MCVFVSHLHIDVGIFGLVLNVEGSLVEGGANIRGGRGPLPHTSRVDTRGREGGREGSSE